MLSKSSLIRGTLTVLLILSREGLPVSLLLDAERFADIVFLAESDGGVPVVETILVSLQRRAVQTCCGKFVSIKIKEGRVRQTSSPVDPYPTISLPAAFWGPHQCSMWCPLRAGADVCRVRVETLPNRGKTSARESIA